MSKHLKEIILTTEDFIHQIEYIDYRLQCRLRAAFREKRQEIISIKPGKHTELVYEERIKLSDQPKETETK